MTTTTLPDGESKMTYDHLTDQELINYAWHMQCSGTTDLEKVLITRFESLLSELEELRRVANQISMHTQYEVDDAPAFLRVMMDFHVLDDDDLRNRLLLAQQR